MLSLTSALLASASGMVVSPPDSLLALVRSELRPNSYLLRNPSAASTIDEACKQLESSSPTPAWPRDLMAIDGSWRLVYSSALALPLPPFDLPSTLFEALEAFPLAPRSVEQKIDVIKRRLVNVVALSPWPKAQLPVSLPIISDALQKLQGSNVVLELDHTFSVEGEGSSGRRQAAAGSVVELRLEEVRRRLMRDEAPADDEWADVLNPQVRRQQQQQQRDASSAAVGKGSGNMLLELVPAESAYSLPGPLGSFAVGAFDTPYADGRVRISRGTIAGPLRELRIFERVGEQTGSKVYATWQEEEDALAAAAAEGDAAPLWGDRWQEGGLDEAEAMDFADEYDGMPDV